MTNPWMVLGAWLFWLLPLAALADTPPAASSTAPAEPTTHLLRYQFQPGEVVRSKVTHRATVETTIAGSTQTADTLSTSIKVWRVLKVEDDGRVVFEHAVESVDMRQQMSGRQEVRYNSQTDQAAPPGFEEVAKLIGVRLSVVTIDQAGNILGREDHHKSAQGLGGAQMVVPLPSEPVPVGHVWTVPDEVVLTLEDNQVKRIKTRQRYELEKVQHQVATIAVETQVITPVNDPKIRAQLIQRLSRGSIRFDLDAGRVLSQQTDLDERVIGFSGPDSSLRYLTRFTEELIPSQRTATRRQAQP
jgi:hypothetical protein